MNGFFNTQLGTLALQDLTDLQTKAESLYIVDTPSTGTEITGLVSGDTIVAAEINSSVLNAALSAGGTLDLIIPDSSGAVDGVWYTAATVYIYADTTLTWIGTTHQLAAAVEPYSNYFVFRTDSPNITLNNPLISQRYVQVRPLNHGTHACLAIYGSSNTGNITINDGILEWGGYNCFQGGRSNTTFNRTIFRDAGEHLVYGSGTINTGIASGLTFNDCVFDRPGNNEQVYELESNHLQIRKFANVELNRCTIQGEKKTYYTGFGINATDIDGMTLNYCTIDDYTAAAINFKTDELTIARDLVVNDSVFTPTSAPRDVLRQTSVTNAATFNRVTINEPFRIGTSSTATGGGESEWNNCIFNITDETTQLVKYSDATFDSCTFDVTNATTTTAMTADSNSSATFTGTTIKIGTISNWGLIP